MLLSVRIPPDRALVTPKILSGTMTLLISLTVKSHMV